MRRFIITVCAVLLVVSAQIVTAQARPTGLICVGVYSETSDGYVSYRIGSGAWNTVKVGDNIPANGEIRINVERDWVELVPADNPNTVFELTGPASGESIKKVADILKGKARTVTLPKISGGKADPKFADKLVVTRYLGRQIYIGTDGKRKDIKYGDVMDRTGKVQIIAINNTLTLMNPTGQVTTVVGPLKFDVAQVLDNKQLYKFLNVLK